MNGASFYVYIDHKICLYIVSQNDDARHWRTSARLAKLIGVRSLADGHTCAWPTIRCGRKHYDVCAEGLADVVFQ